MILKRPFSKQKQKKNRLFISANHLQTTHGEKWKGNIEGSHRNCEETKEYINKELGQDHPILQRV